MLPCTVHCGAGIRGSLGEADGLRKGLAAHVFHAFPPSGGLLMVGHAHAGVFIVINSSHNAAAGNTEDANSLSVSCTDTTTASAVGGVAAQGVCFLLEGCLGGILGRKPSSLVQCSIVQKHPPFRRPPLPPTPQERSPDLRHLLGGTGAKW